MTSLKNIIQLDQKNQYCSNNLNNFENLDLGIWNTQPDELYVIGDLHGDFFVMKQALELSGCVEFEETEMKDFMDKNFNLIDGCNVYSSNENDFNKKKFIRWNSNKKNCFIVFAGDIIDRCRFNIIKNKCNNVIDENCDFLMLKLIFDLDNQAKKYDSRVILILGNHEIMNLQDITTYVSIKGKQDENRLYNIKKLLNYNKNRIYGIIRINFYVIVHGGINANFFNCFNNKNINKYIIFNENMEKIKPYNLLLRKYICNKITNNLIKNPFKNKIKTINNITEDIQKNFITNLKSPFWDRTNSLNMTKHNCDDIFIKNTLNIPIDLLNYLKIIVAHCPQTNLNINLIPCYEHSDKNYIWRIDIAMSKAWNEYDLNNVIKLINKKFNGIEMINKTINSNFKEINIIELYKNIINNEIINSVKILKIKNTTEEIINSNVNTINYFYETIFKNNELNKYYFIFSDIEKYLNNKNSNDIFLLSSIKTIKNELYIKLKNKVFSI